MSNELTRLNIYVENKESARNSATQNLANVMKEVIKLTICPHCNFLSQNYSQCDRCQQILPSFAKRCYRLGGKKMEQESSSSTTTIQSETTTENSYRVIQIEVSSLDTLASFAGPNRKRTAKKKGQQDDNSGFANQSQSMTEAAVKRNRRNNNKNNVTEYENENARKNDDKVVENEAPIREMEIRCRSVRVGSLKHITSKPVLISREGVKWNNMSANESNETVEIQILSQDVTKILYHFGRTMPAMFVYITPESAEDVRERLQMTDPKGPFFNPSSKSEHHRKITFLPEKVSDEQKKGLKKIFSTYGLSSPKSNGDVTSDSKLIAEIDSEMVNNILIMSTPNALTKYMQRKKKQTKDASS